MYKKRKRSSPPLKSPRITNESSRSWKGRVLVQNKTVKKADRATKKVVWFSAEPEEDMHSHVVSLTEKTSCPDSIKARQCLQFELHYKFNHRLPNGSLLMVLATIHRADTKEEVKEGVINNFTYVHCSNNHGVAIFQKLYLETRSQCAHYIEFTLWVEKLNNSDSVGCYGRETFSPVRGNNTFRTPTFIPKAASCKSGSEDRSDDTNENAGIKFIKIVPNSGNSGDTLYLTFFWPGHEKDTGGEIYVIWNDEIVHVPYFPKASNEKIVVLDRIPPGDPETEVTVYLKEKPPQGSREDGVLSNPVSFIYKNRDKNGNWSASELHPRVSASRDANSIGSSEGGDAHSETWKSSTSVTEDQSDSSTSYLGGHNNNTNNSSRFSIGNTSNQTRNSKLSESYRDAASEGDGNASPMYTTTTTTSTSKTTITTSTSSKNLMGNSKTEPEIVQLHTTDLISHPITHSHTHTRTHSLPYQSNQNHTHNHKQSHSHSHSQSHVSSINPFPSSPAYISPSHLSSPRTKQLTSTSPGKIQTSTATINNSNNSNNSNFNTNTSNSSNSGNYNIHAINPNQILNPFHSYNNFNLYNNNYYNNSNNTNNSSNTSSNSSSNSHMVPNNNNNSSNNSYGVQNNYNQNNHQQHQHHQQQHQQHQQHQQQHQQQQHQQQHQQHQQQQQQQQQQHHQQHNYNQNNQQHHMQNHSQQQHQQLAHHHNHNHNHSHQQHQVQQPVYNSIGTATMNANNNYHNHGNHHNNHNMHHNNNHVIWEQNELELTTLEVGEEFYMDDDMNFFS